MKPKQAKPVLIVLADGSVHEGHYLKNANKYEKNVNRWRIYKTGKTVEDKEVVAWIYMEDLQKAVTNYEAIRDMMKLQINLEI